ncbi:MAG: HAMP domain-containing histidine kinase [Sphingomonadales bacterium]|nr:HAMP domain-containing histidine kinase [Sphingomonadales bacterium]MDE2570034.1 HAMP domain-containing histidine kinase [Sphingomonadales bacterium]
MGAAVPTGLSGPLRARCDERDWLVEADEQLAALQRRCGGTFPGMVAVPALLALVRKARCEHLRLSRTVAVNDDGQPIALWARVEPFGNGTIVEISQWRAAPEGEAVPLGDAALLDHVAGLSARLDEKQRVILAEARDSRLGALADDMTGRRGSRWTDFVSLAEPGAREGLHWRLLDGSTVTVPGVGETWQARIIPRAAGGLDLFLIAEAIGSVPGPVQRKDGEKIAGGYHALLARELGPALVKPINRIIANAETIRTRLAGPLAEAYGGYASDIAEAGRHLLGLVEDLADLEAIEAPDFRTAPDAIDLADCARRAAGILQVRAAEREISLAVPPEHPRVPATGEDRRVLQVLLNLVGNAIRYSPENTTVTLRCGVRDGHAWISVEDEGAGLSIEQAARVFDKFERLGRSGDGGSGLGLYISRRLARAMKGDLTAGRSDSGGARFELTLPAR